jgi:uncharacterized protein YndB with AHSA1/START domain
VITEPAQICRWFSDEADVEARSGTDGALTWKPGGRGGSRRDADMIVPITVIDAEPFRRFSFRWNHPHGAVADEANSALVEFRLTEEANGTRLRVLESGIEALTHDGNAKSRYVEEHAEGWQRHFGELRDYVTARSSGAVR